MRLYILGHIMLHKHTHWGRPYFEEAAANLRSRGHEVCNPIQVDDGMGGPEAVARHFHHAWLIALDSQIIATCDGVVCFDGWETSKGSRQEVFTALSYGKDIYRLVPENLLTQQGLECVGKGLEYVPPDVIAAGLLRVFDGSGETMPILARITQERRFQDEKWGEQNHPDGTGSDMQRQRAVAARSECQVAAAEKALTWDLILEEEKAEAFAESDPEKLSQELVETAAVAVAWIESIKRRGP